MFITVKKKKNEKPNKSRVIHFTYTISPTPLSIQWGGGNQGLGEKLV